MKSKTHEEKTNEMGLMGEKIIVNMLSEQGYKVVQSIDKYDNEKDLMADGKTVEVKTQVPFIMESAFTIKENQLTKCREVNRLFFISVPAPNRKYSWSGYVYEADPKTFEVRYRRTKDGRNMVLIDKDQPAIKQVCKLDESVVRELVKYTVSEY